MKRMLMVAALIAMVCSCNKEGLETDEGKFQESVVYISLNRESDVKSVGDGHGVQAEDNNIHTLEIFIFRINEGKPDDGVLDGYRRFTAAELGTLTDLEVQTTTGRKVIYAVANAHRENWKDINTRALFERQTARLVQDDVRNFVMQGSTEAELQLASTVAFPIRRLVSRVRLNCVKTSFAGGPYEGMSLKGVKAYLTNVQAEKYLYNGTGQNISVLNADKYNMEDAASCTMPGMIYDDLGVDIDDSGYDTPHYFYCYGNDLEVENETEKYTRIVIEGELNGVTYYYPIAIEGIDRNSCYVIDVIIKRPGSLTPDSDVEVGALLASVSVLDWNMLPGNIVEF